MDTLPPVWSPTARRRPRAPARRRPDRDVHPAVRASRPRVFGGPPDSQDVTITVTGTVDPGIAGATRDQLGVGDRARGDQPGGQHGDGDRRRSPARPTSASSRRRRRRRSWPAATSSTTWPSPTPDPSAATNAVLTDVLPAGVTFDPALSDSPPCTVVRRQRPCALGTVAAGATTSCCASAATSTRRTPAPTSPTRPASLRRQRRAGRSPRRSPRRSSSSADLAVTKVATQEAFAAGSQAEFTLTVTNDGPSTARALTLTDATPAGTTLAAVTPAAPLTCTTLPVRGRRSRRRRLGERRRGARHPGVGLAGHDQQHRRRRLADARPQPGDAHRRRRRPRSSATPTCPCRSRCVTDP